MYTMCCDISNYFCQKCPILSFCERLVYFFASSILSKMLNFVIFWETLVFFRFFNFVKNAQFCHFLRGPWIFSLLHFCQKCSILSFSERPLYFFASSILSKMLNFVIFWEDHGFVRFFNFVKNTQFCHFLRGHGTFSLFNIVKNGPFCHFLKVHFKLWDKHKYTMCTHYVLWYIKLILSKLRDFVIFWEACVFFRFFNFVKNAQFCHFLREESVFFFHFFNFVINGPFCHIWKVDYKLWDKHKYTMSTHYVLWYSKLFLSEMPHFVILWEARVFFRFFNFVKNAQFCHFLRGQCIFFNFSIFVKNGPFCNFWNADFKLWDKHKRILCIHYVLWYIKLFFVKNAPFCHFVRGPCIFSLLQFCQKCSVLSFSEWPVHIFQFFNFCQKWSIL